LEEAFSNGATVPEASKLVTDEAVKSCFVAGSPEECQHQIEQLMDTAQTLDFDQVCFAKLGPDYAEAITLLRDEILSK
jgi:alkanesulfonate monooxygenase SsuD/methylene tetrahydromethanopterin reductase-like flavin-dependent oxidoreductase (luciferase family)